MDENPAIALSFRDQFIPAMSYSYTYDRTYRRNRFFWQNTVTSAGNLLYAIWEACGQHGTKRLFNNQFSQFIKDVNEVKFYQKLGDKNNWLAYRFWSEPGMPTAIRASCRTANNFISAGPTASGRLRSVRSAPAVIIRPERPQQLSRPDRRFQAGSQCGIPFRDYGAAGRSRISGCREYLAAQKRSEPSGRRAQMARFLQRDRARTGGLRYDISYLVLRADLGIALHTPYPNPDKPGYYNISKFKDGLGFHVAIGYPF